LVATKRQVKGFFHRLEEPLKRTAMNASGLLLVFTVAVVGVLHTIVPDHWVPIALLARQRGWSKAETARIALQAGIGHVVTTLIIGLAVWGAGVAFAMRFGHLVDDIASIALIAFGGWIGISAWRELHDGHGHGHGHHDHTYTTRFVEHAHGPHGHDHRHHHDDDADDDSLYAPLRGGVSVLTRHAHAHRHGGIVHGHRHDHEAGTAHEITAEIERAPPLHVHKHKTSSRMALLLILGSSPMVEGIPAFFAASRYGVTLLLLMAVVFAISTIATYVILCVYSASGLQRVKLGPIERYGEVISGAFIALVGVIFWLWPVI
jgi:ABC-type nickel/cobalt efflux system permease component RcnA